MSLAGSFASTFGALLVGMLVVTWFSVTLGGVDSKLVAFLRWATLLNCAALAASLVWFVWS